MNYKFIITGSMGVGKTTAIATISDIKPTTAEAKNTDISTNKKTTTVGYDYGELLLDSGERIYIYGTPGQERFSFIWKVLSQGAHGLVILIDSLRVNPVEDLGFYLDNFSSMLKQSGCVIGVTRLKTSNISELAPYIMETERRGASFPITAVDIRKRSDVEKLLQTLTLQIKLQHETEHAD